MRRKNLNDSIYRLYEPRLRRMSSGDPNKDLLSLANELFVKYWKIRDPKKGDFMRAIAKALRHTKKETVVEPEDAPGSCNLERYIIFREAIKNMTALGRHASALAFNDCIRLGEIRNKMRSQGYKHEEITWAIQEVKETLKNL